MCVPCVSVCACVCMQVPYLSVSLYVCACVCDMCVYVSLCAVHVCVCCVSLYVCACVYAMCICVSVLVHVCVYLWGRMGVEVKG